MPRLVYTMDSLLLPVDHSRILLGFTTSSVINLPNVTRTNLSDQTLGVHKVSSGTSHHIVTPPVFSSPLTQHECISEAWEASFPTGSINPGNKKHPLGGFGFYLRGPAEFSNKLEQGVTEVLMSYEVAFEEEFSWCLGGKLPGMYGGVGNSAYGCTGGRQTDRCKCFNLRLMWRENGAGELYAYIRHSPKNAERLKQVPPKSVQHPDYGFSVGRGAFRFPAGEWVAIAERVKMNTVGVEDGKSSYSITFLSYVVAKNSITRRN